MKKIKITVFLLFTLLLALIYLCGCSCCCCSDNGAPSFTGAPGQPLLLFVSNRYNPGGVYGAIYTGYPDFKNGAIVNLRMVSSPDKLGLYTDPYKVPLQDTVICAMTQGSMLWNDIRSVDYYTGQVVTLTNSDERNNLHPVYDWHGRIVYSSYVRDSKIQEIRSMKMDGTDDKLVTQLNAPR